jgi:8-oxo-dGTP diphosphatase
MADIHKAGLLVIHNDRLLLCRKNRTTSLLILPGGKYEPAESAEDCLRREIREELGDVDVVGIEFVGTYIDEAAGTAGKTVQIDVYRGELSGIPHPNAEIAELIWFGASDDRSLTSPAIKNKILPDLMRRGILRWQADARHSADRSPANV